PTMSQKPTTFYGNTHKKVVVFFQERLNIIAYEHTPCQVKNEDYLENRLSIPVSGALSLLDLLSQLRPRSAPHYSNPIYNSEVV
ncbi:MAG: hypothetical protein ABF904_15195, partial [Ethanoligenens sp.]